MYDVVKLIEKLAQSSMRFGRYLYTPYRDKPVEVLPGIVNTDPRLLNTQADLAREFKNMFPKTGQAVGGFIKSPYVIGSLDNIHQIAGYPFNPLGSIPMNKEQPAVDKKYLFYLSKITKLFNVFKPSAIRLNRLSHCGLPDFSSDLTVKLKYTIDAYNNIERIMIASERFLKDGNVDHLISTGVYPFYTETRRYQHTDFVRIEHGYIAEQKLRSVWNWEANRVIVDRKISSHPNFSRVRSRLAYAMSGTINYVMQYFATGWQKAFSEKYAFTFKHDPANLRDKLKRFSFIYGLDVSNFDQNQTEQMHDVMFNNMSIFDDGIKTIIKAMLRYPIILKNDYLGEKGFKVVQPIIENIYYGNPSGIAFVSPFGKVQGLPIGLLLLAKAAGRDFSDEEIDIILKGQSSSFAILNMGDDMVVAISDPIIAAKFANMSKLNQLNIKPYSITFESIVSFLGNLFPLDLDYTMNDIRNMILKIHIPERSVGGSHRPYFAYGFRERLNNYKHPFFNEIYALWNSVFYKNFSKELLDAVPLDKSPPAVVFGHNLADSIFIDNPQSINYKLDPDEVSPGVLEMYFATITPDKLIKLEQYIK